MGNNFLIGYFSMKRLYKNFDFEFFNSIFIPICAQLLYHNSSPYLENICNLYLIPISNSSRNKVFNRSSKIACAVKLNMD